MMSKDLHFGVRDEFGDLVDVELVARFYRGFARRLRERGPKDIRQIRRVGASFIENAEGGQENI